MPYNTISELPERIRKFSEVVQRQWMHVFNSVYNKVLKETGNKQTAEARAYSGANSVLKQRFKGRRSMEKNSRPDYFNHLIENWLGNLKG